MVTTSVNILREHKDRCVMLVSHMWTGHFRKGKGLPFGRVLQGRQFWTTSSLFLSRVLCNVQLYVIGVVDYDDSTWPYGQSLVSEYVSWCWVVGDWLPSWSCQKWLWVWSWEGSLGGWLKCCFHSGNRISLDVVNWGRWPIPYYIYNLGSIHICFTITGIHLSLFWFCTRTDCSAWSIRSCLVFWFWHNFSVDCLWYRQFATLSFFIWWFVFVADKFLIVQAHPVTQWSNLLV